MKTPFAIVVGVFIFNYLFTLSRAVVCTRGTGRQRLGVLLGTSVLPVFYPIHCR